MFDFYFVYFIILFNNVVLWLMSACFLSEMADDVDNFLTPLISDFDVSTELTFSGVFITLDY